MFPEQGCATLSIRSGHYQGRRGCHIAVPVLVLDTCRYRGRACRGLSACGGGLRGSHCPLPGRVQRRSSRHSWTVSSARSSIPKHDAGATVAVVKDGQLLFSKGYGYADATGRIPVGSGEDAVLDRLGFKLFTWTAIMQLVEQQKLDLDADVNRYLTELKIPETYPHPITIRNLLTHTTGLEDGFIGYMFSASEQERPSMSQALSRHMPARVHPPATDFNSGELCAYSNWGATLAGHIAATVAGEDFDAYIRQHVFEPLGMSSSTFRQPLPEALAGRDSIGYTFENGAFEPKTLVLDNFAPAGSMASTANDMARFMIAHLQNGQLADKRILSEASVQLMHERALSPDPHLNGVGLGFFENWLNGRRTIGHGGNGPEFTALLMLIPEAKVGLFVAYNTANAAGADNELQRAFMDHYFPARLPPIKPPADAVKRNEALRRQLHESGGAPIPRSTN